MSADLVSDTSASDGSWARIRHQHHRRFQPALGYVAPPRERHGAGVGTPCRPFASKPKLMRVRAVCLQVKQPGYGPDHPICPVALAVVGVGGRAICGS